MSGLTAFAGEEDWDCPLCMEEMDLSDKNFRPCPCGYQVCRFCWHKIREDGNQRCPACRKVYDEAEAEFTPVPLDEMNRLRQRKRALKEKREAAAQAELDHSPAGVAATNEIINSRRHLADFRVVQRNLVYVIGISARIASENVLKDTEFFGQFGKIIKIVVNKKNFLASATTSNPPSASAYVTFARKDDAARAIELVDGSVFDDRVIRATYGTTKYCSYFLRGLTCQNPGCMYLHEPGEEVSSFTKEQLTAGSHNLHSFIVDKNESANLKQFGTIMGASPAPSPASTARPLAASPAPVPLAVPTPLPASMSVPLRMQNDSPKPGVTSPEPPGLSRAPSVTEERVPIISDICTNTFFERLSKLVPSNDLDDFAPSNRPVSFFSSMSPPPPPIASLSARTLGDRLFSQWNSPEVNGHAGARRNDLNSMLMAEGMPPSMVPQDAIHSRTFSSANEAFSFGNLPIRSPKPTSSPTPIPLPLTETAGAAAPTLPPEAPIPAKSIPVESLFPADYKPVSSKTDADAHASERPESPLPQSVATKKEPVKFTTLEKKKAAEAQQQNQQPPATRHGASPQATAKITAAKPLEPAQSGPSSAAESGRRADVASASASATATNLASKNLFELLHGTEPANQPHAKDSATHAASDAPNTQQTSKIGKIKVVSAYTMPIHTSTDLEKMAREGSLERHISSLEEGMFRSRLESENVESKLRAIFDSTTGRRVGTVSKPQSK